MKRLDQMLVLKGLVSGRDRSKRLIAQGQVQVNGQIITKASTIVMDTDQLLVNPQSQQYVGRGGLKLEKALNFFRLSPASKICMDIGSSTGGFTDCLLQHGAKKVYAIDVGTNQLVPALRKDNRVTVLEQTNIRQLELKEIPDPIQWIVTDVSFLSLIHVFPKAFLFLQPNGTMIALVKPQFEAGPELVGKGGIVTNPKTHLQVLERVINAAYREGLSVRSLTYSPITGSKGNIEYLLYLNKTSPVQRFDTSALEKLIHTAFNQCDARLTPCLEV